VLVALALTGSASGQGESLHRPLHLPLVAARERCPIAPGAVASTLGRGLARMPVAGRVPVYLMSVADEPAGSVSIAGSRADPLGWRGQKAPWVASPRYRGPILIPEPRAVRHAGRSGWDRRGRSQRRGLLALVPALTAAAG
jgi:hypothetical protein